MITYASIQIDIRLNEKWETLHKNIVKKYNRNFDKILYSSLYEEYIFQTISKGIQDVRRFNTLDFLWKNFELSFAKLTIEEVSGIEETIIEWFVKLGLLDKNYCIPKSKMAKFNPKIKFFQETSGDIGSHTGDIQETLKKNRRQTMKNISKYKKKYGEKDHKTLAMIEKLNTINNELKNMSPVAQETSGDIGRHTGNIQETQIFKKEKKTPPYNPPLKKGKKEEDKERGLLRREETTDEEKLKNELKQKTFSSSPSSLFLKQKEKNDVQKPDIGKQHRNQNDLSKFFLTLTDMEIKEKWLDSAIQISKLTKEQIENSNKKDEICFNINLLHSFLQPAMVWFSEETSKKQTFMQKCMNDLLEILEKHTRQGKKQNKQDDLLELWNEWKKNKNSNVYNIFYFVREFTKLEKWESDGNMHQKQCPNCDDYIDFVNKNIEKTKYLQARINVSKNIIDRIKQNNSSNEEEMKIQEGLSLLFG